MNGESSKSRLICQNEIWKTCVICGQLNKQYAMKNLSKSSHLHIFVAYHKFTGSIDQHKDFSTYDDRKTYECFVCDFHVTVPAKALRNIYAFPPDIPLSNGKCDPAGLLRVLKNFMAPEYLNLTLIDLYDAVPDLKVPNVREPQKIDCSCCNLLEKTRRRLKTVIENAEEVPSCVRLNFAVFEELVEAQKDLNFEFVEEDKNLNQQFDAEASRLADERFLMDFERTQMKEQLVDFTCQPLRSINSTTSSGMSKPLDRIRSTESDSGSIIVNENLHPPKPVFDRKRKASLSTSLALTPQSHSDESSSKTLRFLSPQSFNFSPITYSKAHSATQNVSDCAKEIMNTKLVIFTAADLYILLSEKNFPTIHDALVLLTTKGLIQPHLSVTDSTVFIKEVRRENLNELWNFGIIPEHYRQRLIGVTSEDSVRGQFEKYKVALMEMNEKPKISGLIEAILSESCNSTLENRKCGIVERFLKIYRSRKI